jgi:XTP/dITP diphosphohydrolase
MSIGLALSQSPQAVLEPVQRIKYPVPVVAAPNDPVEQFRTFLEIVRILRQECPWDKKQTHSTLMPLLIEEVYEAVEATEMANNHELSKELGDILLHVVMNAVIGEEHGTFSMTQILASETAKLIHRHPHVFANVHETAQADSAEQVEKNWEQLKMQEGRSSALEGVPKHLPALLRAERTQQKASRVGFDWDNAHDVWAKVEEELQEFRQEHLRQEHQHNQERMEEEFGDILFALVNASRFAGINAEQALQRATNKFTKRFQYIEQQAASAGRELRSMTLAEMDTLWNEAKEREKAEKSAAVHTSA